MVVNDLDVVSAAISPNEAYSPLSIDPYAVLSLPIPMQAFELVFWRYFQIFESDCCINHPELAKRHLLDVVGQPSCKFTPIYLLGLFVLEGSDHLHIVPRSGITVKRYGWRGERQRSPASEPLRVASSRNQRYFLRSFFGLKNGCKGDFPALVCRN